MVASVFYSKILNVCVTIFYLTVNLENLMTLTVKHINVVNWAPFGMKVMFFLFFYHIPKVVNFEQIESSDVFRI